MTKKILEISLSFFLIVSAIGILLGLTWVKPMIESQQQLVEEARANQEEMMQSAKQMRSIVTEIGYAGVVLAMSENDVIKPVKANKMMAKTVSNIEKQSERFGEIVKLLNEYRINQQGK